MHPLFQFRTELVIPDYLHKYEIIPYIIGMAKSFLIGNLIETSTDHHLNNDIKIVTKVWFYRNYAIDSRTITKFILFGATMLKTFRIFA